jgi:hypothetical protein
MFFRVQSICKRIHKLLEANKIDEPEIERVVVSSKIELSNVNAIEDLKLVQKITSQRGNKFESN